MSLTDGDLRRVRDEIGDSVPPTDDDLYALYDDLSADPVVAGRYVGPVPWQLVAVSILKRRYATYMTSGTSSSITIPGVIAVAGARQEGILAPQLLEQIRRLEALAGGIVGGRIPYRNQRARSFGRLPGGQVAAVPPPWEPRGL